MKNIPKALLFITAGLGLVVIVLIAFMAGTKTTNPNSTETVTANTNINARVAANTNAANNNVNDTPVVSPATEITTGVTWLDEPEVLPNLGLLKSDSEYTHYYRVGTFPNGGSVIYEYEEAMGKIVNRFKESADGNYALLANHSQGYISGSPTDYLTDGVTVDTKTAYPELDYPDTLTVNGLDLSLYTVGFQSYALFSDISDDLTELGSSDYGVVYKLTTPITTQYNNGSIEGKKYILKLADGSVAIYADTLAFLADDGSITADWDKTYSDFRDRQYMPGVVAEGCGVIGGNQYPVDMAVESLETVGGATASDGDTLYTVLDGENPLLRNAYEAYKVGRDYEGSIVDLLSYSEFVAETPLLLWQDAVSDYILLMDSAYAPAVECGKPVVYLYPTTTTEVHVQVGAEVRISEPSYEAGWTVKAEPTGKLTLADGSVYPNLFWEGKGYGEYPQITFGRVVPRSQVGTALRSDLIKQGLNAQEIKDFLEFWMPHMPNTPYVRLSWLSTEQMNTLAPLNIQPRPDTVIRVFLDFAGQTTKQTNLQPQTLTAVARNGFTVTEWGGLLLGQ